MVQLIGKTNQFNLTTRRRNRAELEAFLARRGRASACRCASPTASPTTGSSPWRWPRCGRPPAGRALEIDTLLMSCRVLGRGVEALVLAELGRLAAEAGCTAVTGSYIPTERNGMVADLYPRHGFAETDCGGAGRPARPAGRLTPRP